MYAPQLSGQHATLFAGDCAPRGEQFDGNGSTGSWDTTYSAEEAGWQAPIDLAAKGHVADRGSPMSQLYAMERAGSSPMPGSGLCGMASLSLEDSRAFLQAS